jgi:glycosyltransferase involved in cell wall biosynthesis
MNNKVLSAKIWVKKRLPSILFKPVQDYYPVGMISKVPYIFLSSYYGSGKHPFWFLYPLAAVLINKEVNWIFICTWHINEDTATVCYKDIKFFRRLFSKHKVFFLANTLEEELVMRNAGIMAIHCSHNCLIDERLFRPIPNASKVFQALYDARLSPYKRFELGHMIGQLAIITYKDESSVALNYAKEIKRLLTNASWLNWKKNLDYKYLIPREVNEIINLAKVGLCLSATEGAMYASIQYLLAGLPVVTTHNLGGRDEFFDPEYVEWVDNNPKAVEAGVQKLIDKKTDPIYIRTRTCEKVKEHRKRFIGLIQSIWDEHRIERNFENEWDGLFFNKLQDQSLTWSKIFSREVN